MKIKYRKGKPPLRIQEKGDATRKPHKKKSPKILKGTIKFEPPLEVKAGQTVYIAKETFMKSIKHGTPVTVKVGEHAGETAVVIGPSKTLPGRLGVLTLGGLVHYKPEDLEVEK